MPERDDLELKESFDPEDRNDCLSLVKEIVALANAGGGSVRLGESETGERPGLEVSARPFFDAARLGDLVSRYISPDSVEFTVLSELADSEDRIVVDVEVLPASDPPLVFTRPGNAGTGREQIHVFAKHSVYRRRNTKAEPATREDYRRWIDDAAEAERDRWRSRVRMIAELPDDAMLVQVADGDEVDEPTALLRRAVRAYQRNPEKLLTAKELAELFLVRGSLAIDAGAFELLVQSALRRKATLFFWLSTRSLNADEVEKMLLAAVGGSDRDKSDAARAITEVGGLFLDESAYGRVVAKLTDSRYQHFREAAATAPTLEDAARMIGDARPRSIERRSAQEWASAELLSEAEGVCREVLASGSSGARSRKLVGLGLEYLMRSRGGTRSR